MKKEINASINHLHLPEEKPKALEAGSPKIPQQLLALFPGMLINSLVYYNGYESLFLFNSTVASAAGAAAHSLFNKVFDVDRSVYKMGWYYRGMGFVVVFAASEAMRTYLPYIGFFIGNASPKNEILAMKVNMWVNVIVPPLFQAAISNLMAKMPGAYQLRHQDQNALTELMTADPKPSYKKELFFAALQYAIGAAITIGFNKVDPDVLPSPLNTQQQNLHDAVMGYFLARYIFPTIFQTLPSPTAKQDEFRLSSLSKTLGLGALISMVFLMNKLYEPTFGEKTDNKSLDIAMTAFFGFAIASSTEFLVHKAVPRISGPISKVASKVKECLPSISFWRNSSEKTALLEEPTTIPTYNGA